MFHGKRVFGGPSFLFKTRGGLVIFPVGYDGGEGSGWMMWSQKRVGWWNTWKPPFRLWWNFDQMHSVSFLISSKHFNFEVGKLFFFSSQNTRFNIPPKKHQSPREHTGKHTSPLWNSGFVARPWPLYVSVRGWTMRRPWVGVDLGTKNFRVP